jgi:hypothetical protein
VGEWGDAGEGRYALAVAGEGGGEGEDDDERFVAS